MSRKAKAPVKEPERAPSGPGPKISEIVLLDVVAIRANSWNANEMAPAAFDQLCEDVQTYGFDGVVTVAPVDEGPIRWQVVDGEHRWRAARALGMPQVPCVVKTGLTEDELKLMTVRRNELRGEINPVKATKLIHDLARRHDLGAIRRGMALTSEQRFKRVFLEAREQKDQAAKELAAEGQRTVRTVADVGMVVKDLLAKHGDTIPQSYVYFVFGGHPHLIVEMTAAVRQWIDMVRAEAHARGCDVNAVLLEWIGGGVRGAP